MQVSVGGKRSDYDSGGKVNIPTSRDIMGSAKGGKKSETTANYEHELDGVTLANGDLADCLGGLDSICKSGSGHSMCPG